MADRDRDGTRAAAAVRQAARPAHAAAGPRSSGAEAGTIDRRAFVASAARLGLAASTLGALDALAFAPARSDAATRRPDIQFDVAGAIAPARTVDGVVVRFPPVYTSFTTFKLRRRPSRADRQRLRAALRDVERRYAFSPRGVLLTVAYGVPYFARLPRALVRHHIPRLRADPARPVLEEAVPGPTDVHASNPGVAKRRFDMPVRIESNDVLVIARSDSTRIVDAVVRQLVERMDGLLRVTSRRLMFQQMGLPRKVAERERLAFAGAINPRSPMWMGFADQQIVASAPAPVVTFAGTHSARLTTARHEDYFDNGCIVHLSHLVEDLEQFYAEPYADRVQCMFRPNPPPAAGNADQFADGGGPAFLQNAFHDPADVRAGAAATRRIGHLTALQRCSRAPDTTPLHIRADGAGFDALDVPDGSRQPKLHFAMFVPTAQVFADMRRAQASLDLVQEFGLDERRNGIERFVTATRRQNFLVPPRRHRAFPLVELGGR
jgi:hypothetical protein